MQQARELQPLLHPVRLETLVCLHSRKQHLQPRHQDEHQAADVQVLPAAEQEPILDILPPALLPAAQRPA